MHEQLIKEIQKMVRDGEVPAKSVAEAVGKPYSTLMREINPYDKGAKLGVETFMAIIETTGPRIERGNPLRWEGPFRSSSPDFEGERKPCGRWGEPL